MSVEWSKIGRNRGRVQEPLIRGISDQQPMIFRTDFAGLTAHLRLFSNSCGWCLYGFLALGPALPCFAQELEPRRWSHLPIGTNFAGAGYAYTAADISIDPVLLIENADMEMHTWGVKYIRTFELFEKSARVDFAQAYQEGRWAECSMAFPPRLDEAVGQTRSCDSQ